MFQTFLLPFEHAEFLLPNESCYVAKLQLLLSMKFFFDEIFFWPLLAVEAVIDCSTFEASQQTFWKRISKFLIYFWNQLRNR